MATQEKRGRRDGTMESDDGLVWFGEEQYCSKCKVLEQRVRELEEDRQWLRGLLDTMRRQLDTFSDMRTMLAELVTIHRQHLPVNSPPIVISPPPTDTSPPPTDTSPPPAKVKPQRTTRSPRPTTSSPPATAGQPANEDEENEEVVIGGTLRVNKLRLQRCNHVFPTKLVCDLLEVVFTRRELATSSLTGQKGSAKEEIKPPLEPTALKAIYEYTLNEFPNADISVLRGAVRNKLNNVSKVFKRTQMARKGLKHGGAEEDKGAAQKEQAGYGDAKRGSGT
ncbi:BEN domain-containing protein 6-like [Engraulis encrasicolus]|uniref:BEN domain-containing protein 6-like n=1 Tax=Engraulis encrasicolus TaxID=184585 RepID=UPI002FD0ADAA